VTLRPLRGGVDVGHRTDQPAHVQPSQALHHDRLEVFRGRLAAYESLGIGDLPAVSPQIIVKTALANAEPSSLGDASMTVGTFKLDP